MAQYINKDTYIGDTGVQLKNIFGISYVDYLNQCSFSGCTLNANFNYIRKYNDFVIFNISVTLNSNLSANTYFEGIVIPTAIRPKGNIVFSAFSHSNTSAKVQYLRHTDGHLVMAFPSQISSGSELNLWGMYLLK